MWKLFLILLLIATSCTIEKRLHRPGYHVSFRSLKKKVDSRQSEIETQSNDDLIVQRSTKSNEEPKTVATGSVDRAAGKEMSLTDSGNDDMLSSINKDRLALTPIEKIKEPSETGIAQETNQSFRKEESKTPIGMILFALLMLLLIGIPGAFYPLVTGIVIVIISPILGGMSGGLAGMIAVALWGGVYIALSFTMLSPLAIYFIGIGAFALFAGIAGLIQAAIDRKQSE